MHTHKLNTRTEHYKDGKLKHTFETGWAQIWRSAAVCWGEGLGGWKVIGKHYREYKRHARLLKVTQALDCAFYDGWWEKDPPPEHWKFSMKES